LSPQVESILPDRDPVYETRRDLRPTPHTAHRLRPLRNGECHPDRRKIRCNPPFWAEFSTFGNFRQSNGVPFTAQRKSAVQLDLGILFRALRIVITATLCESKVPQIVVRVLYSAVDPGRNVHR